MTTPPDGPPRPDEAPPRETASPAPDGAPASRAPRVAAIVLAGGRSRRFGTDKLAAALDGRPLLWHALDPIASLVDELVVVVGHEAAAPALPPIAPRPAIARDPLADGGPLVALLAGLRAVSAPLAIVIGGDMPLVRPAILGALATALQGSPPAVGLAAMRDAGRLRPLPCAVRVDPALRAAERLVAVGERSLRSLAAEVGTVALDEPAWRPLDPDGSSLRDVDTPGDLLDVVDTTSRRSG